MALSYNWTSMTTLVNNMSPGGNTNQAIGLALGWMSLVGGGPFPTPPAMDPKYQYQQVIILLDRRLEHAGPLVHRPGLNRRAAGHDLRQHQGRRNHAVDRAGQYRRRSRPRRCCRTAPAIRASSSCSRHRRRSSRRSTRLAPRYPTCASPNRRFDQHRESITLRACARTRGMTEARQWIVARRRSVVRSRRGAPALGSDYSGVLENFSSPAPRAPGCRNGAAADPLCGRPELLQLRCGQEDRV